MISVLNVKQVSFLKEIRKYTRTQIMTGLLLITKGLKVYHAHNMK